MNKFYYCYDEYGELKDNALEIAYIHGKLDGVTELSTAAAVHCHIYNTTISENEITHLENLLKKEIQKD